MPDLYSDGRHYDALLGDQSADLDFYLKQAKAAAGPILELACGTGRLTLPMAMAGLDVTGLDLNEPMLQVAREKAALKNLKVEWVRADMRDFSLGRQFPLVLLPYNSLEHLHDAGSLQALFAQLRAHLAPEGRFIFDVHMPSLPLLSRKPGEIFPVEGSQGQAPDGSVLAGEEVSYDDASQVYHIRWHYSQLGEGEPRVDELKLRMFFPQELDALLRQHGFEILGKYAGFQGEAFGPGALKQVLICEASQA